MDMLILLLALLLGGLAGWALRAQARSVAVNRQLLRASLLALLALMGLKLGAQRALFARDLSVLLLAAASALFLVLFFALLFWAWSLLRPRPAAVREDAGGAAGGSHELWALLLNGGCILGGFLLFLALPGAWAARLPLDGAADWLLRALLFCIGFDLGVELHRLDLRKLPPLLLLAPALNVALSLLAGLLFSLLTRLSLREGLLLTAGLGWYSLSSVLLAAKGLALLSLLAFIHNVFRELLSILSAPLAARLSPYLPVYLGGATSMDVMLPFVQRYCGREYTLVSFDAGLVCSLAVLSLVRLIAG